ncbi:MAG: F0F1 ATP synthase subunit alpha [Motiliproteus sp.]
MLADRIVQQTQWVDHYRPGLRSSERGQVVAVGDGIAWISGLPSAALSDILEFADGSRGLVFDLAEQLIGAVLLHEDPQLASGSLVSHTRHNLSIPVGDALLGRVIDPLGNPLDGEEAPDCPQRQPLDGLSPPITARDFVNQPLYTGNRIIDTLLPIGRGQRQLLIGDEGLGRSSIALDTVLHQQQQNVRCVYVLIGQKRSSVLNTLDTLRRSGALEYSTLVVAEARALPGLQYLAPLAGCAIAEAWMARGFDTLVVYDDLSTHARLYRELSLLLRRPPGREAFPGDIFSIHARLLERSTRLNSAHGGGSMTALPIVSTQQGEIAAYIPTNLISITDGQIYLTQELFAIGFKPAIDITRSVSRIGGAAQHPRIKQESGRMKLDYLQFLELESFTHIGAKLEPSMQRQLDRGGVLRAILKQGRFDTQCAECHLSWLLAFNDGLLDGYPLSSIQTTVKTLGEQAFASDLTLDHPRDDWIKAIQHWLPQVVADE